MGNQFATFSKTTSPISHHRLITAVVTAAFLFLLSCCSYIDVAHANFLPEPTPKWSIQLQGSGRLSGRGLRRGNAIIASNDGTKIVVTTIDGSLHIIQTTNQVKTIAVYEPEGKVGANIECRSGATIVYSKQQSGLYFSVESEEKEFNSTKEDFIVYALVEDVQPDEFDADRGRGVVTISRVVAVNMEGVLKWSVDVPGRIEGSPIVGKSGIYVTHNNNGYGALSILRIQPKDGRAAIAATVINRAEEQRRAIPFGPPTLRKAAYWEEESESEDIVIVAENWEAGFSESKGGLYMLSSGTNSATKDKDKDKSSTAEAGSNSYDLVLMSTWSYSAIAPPLVYGESIFVGAAGGTIGGFTGNRKNDLSGITSGREEEISPRWFSQVSPNPRNSSQPIRNQPAMDSEGEYLCVSGVNRDVYCLQSDNGRLLWRAEEGSEILARPHIFGGEDWRKVVYAIETQNGRVHQYDLYSGRSYWDYSCAEISESFCQDAVEADFAIAPSGNIIYYGDIYGRINSLQVASFTTETPTIAPTLEPTRNPSRSPTNTPSPTVGEFSPQVSQDASNAPSVAGKPSDWIIIDGDIGQQSQDGGTDEDNLGPSVEDSASSNTDSSVIVNQQSSKIDSDKLKAYIGAAIAGLCVIMIPILLFSMLQRRRRNKSTPSKNMVVEAFDDSSSNDVESQADINYFSSIETNNACDAGNGDSIEVEIINRSNHIRKNSTKKRGEGSLPDTPDTIQSLESIDQVRKDALAMVVVEKEHDVADPSVEAVNLRQTFDRVVDSQAVTLGDVAPGIRRASNHVEGPIRIENSDKNKEVNHISYFSDDDVPPPPPLEEETSSSSTSKEWTWGSLLEIGTSQSSKKHNSASQILLKKASENLQSKQSACEISSSQEESSTPMSTRSQREIHTKEEPPVQKKTGLPIKKMRWGKKSKKKLLSSSIEYGNDSIENDQAEIPTAMKQEAECQTSPRDELTTEINPEDVFAKKDVSKEREKVTEKLLEEPMTNDTEDENQVYEEPNTGTESSIPPPQTPTSPSTYSLLSDEVQTLSPVRSLQSVKESLSSPNHSSTKSVDSDDDSLYTSYTGGTVEKKQDAKSLSPLSNYVYDQDIHRRGRSEIVNEGKRHLAQPVMSKSYTGSVLDDHPDDESITAPGNQYLSEDTNGLKYGRSVRSKSDSNSFQSSNTTGSEFAHKPLAQMYDQLAALGQQRREERKPGFKRRSKRTVQENFTPSQQETEQRGDTWGSFLNELAEAEKEFFSPSPGKTKSLLGKGGIEENEISELDRNNEGRNQ